MTSMSLKKLLSKHHSEAGQKRWRRASLASNTHSFLSTWSNASNSGYRCQICDEKAFFKRYTCRQCNLTGHKKCLKETVIECSEKYPSTYRFSVFGTDLNIFGGRIPDIIYSCVIELESRGFSKLKRIYLSRPDDQVVNLLVKSFNIAPSMVDLSEIDIHSIAEVLKRFLLELKEPLVTYEGYSKCIYIATLYPMVIDLTGDYQLKVQLVTELLAVVRNLPTSHRSTLAFLCHHLRKVVDNRRFTEASIYEIAEIFAPLILRPPQDTDKVVDIFEAYRRARFTEVLIEFTNDIFGPCPSFSRYCSLCSLEPRKSY